MADRRTVKVRTDPESIQGNQRNLVIGEYPASTRADDHHPTQRTSG